jgi:hypothetical protein
MAKKRRFWSRWFGRFEREIGETTGDRAVEAKGFARAVTGKKPDPATVEDELDVVRRRHGDIDARN